MRLPKLREPAPCLLQILAIASCVQRHAQRPPALSTSYQPHSPAVTQACRKLTNYGTLEIELTIDDPKAYTKPWAIHVIQILAPDTELLDYICLENEKDVKHFEGK
jgi:hypothetical protein